MKAAMRPMTSGLKKALDKTAGSAKSHIKTGNDLLFNLVEVERLKAYQCLGETHLTPYCIRVLKLDPNVAAVFVRIVKKSVEVPELAQAVINGDVTFTKAKTIASVITPENKEEWL